jgi:hypothetical protein
MEPAIWEGSIYWYMYVSIADEGMLSAYGLWAEGSKSHRATTAMTRNICFKPVLSKGSPISLPFARFAGKFEKDLF